MEEVGQLGGELFPKGMIPALVKYLTRRGIYLHEGVNGSFDGGTRNNDVAETSDQTDRQARTLTHA